jgi:hypothetical protein
VTLKQGLFLTAIVLALLVLAAAGMVVRGTKAAASYCGRLTMLGRSRRGVGPRRLSA